MPYDNKTGKWTHPGGSCSQCNSRGFVMTKEKTGDSPDSVPAHYVWKCNCHIGVDRQLNYPPYSYGARANKPDYDRKD